MGKLFAKLIRALSPIVDMAVMIAIIAAIGFGGWYLLRYVEW